MPGWPASTGSGAVRKPNPPVRFRVLDRFSGGQSAAVDPRAFVNDHSKVADDNSMMSVTRAAGELLQHVPVMWLGVGCEGQADVSPGQGAGSCYTSMSLSNFPSCLYGWGGCLYGWGCQAGWCGYGWSSAPLVSFLAARPGNEGQMMTRTPPIWHGLGTIRGIVIVLVFGSKTSAALARTGRKIACELVPVPVLQACHARNLQSAGSPPRARGP